jgi:Sulfotransferase domain
MADPKPIALWAVPRSLSTAFERVFVERDDLEVLHEPFSAAYYYGPDRLSERYADEAPKPENSYESVLAEVFRPREKRLFLKDMPYQAKGVMSREFIRRFTNTFIIRDPKYVLSSLYKMWPDFTLEETGFEQIYWAFKYAEEAGQDPVVVDAMTFSEDPVGILSVYCERVGIPFRPDALSWEPGEVEKWKSWEGWHEAAQRSTGIKRAERRDPELPDELQEAYEECLPYYYALAAHTISPG